MANPPSLVIVRIGSPATWMPLRSAALCMSSALWFGDNSLRKAIQREGIAQDLRIYLDVGGREGSDKEGQSMVDDSKDMYATLLAAGRPESSLRFVFDPAAAHNEAFWARRFPAAWEWLRR